MTEYLHDLDGEWIAFRPTGENRYIFDTDGEWLGWTPWDDTEVVTPDGDYLGTIVNDRLLRDFSHTMRGVPAYPGAPAYPGLPAFPGAAGYLGEVGGYEDVVLHRHAQSA